MNLIEGWGSGIPKLMQALKEYGLPEPEFVDMEIALRINLYRRQNNIEIIHENDINKKIVTRNNTGEETNKEINTINKTDGETNEEKSTGEKILDSIKENPYITQIQLANKTGLSYSGVRYIMRQLQNDGILERIGSTKKGQWIIKA